MEWFAFLIYFLIALFCSSVLWFTIKLGFRDSTSLKSAFPESTEFDTLPAVAKARLFWNFSSALIVVLTLILLMGISVRQLPLSHPVTLTLGGALILIWVISLWSRMLSFGPPAGALLPDLPEFEELESKPVPETTDEKEGA